MAKGQVSKDLAVQDIIKGLGTHYLGMADKKIYCEYEENGEMVQVAIALTCPKTPVEFNTAAEALTNDWSGPVSGSAPAPQPQSIPEITQEEKDNLQAMLTKLGL